MDAIVPLLARLGKPFDFDAIDERPVDLVFLLPTTAPQGAVRGVAATALGSGAGEAAAGQKRRRDDAAITAET